MHPTHVIGRNRGCCAGVPEPGGGPGSPTQSGRKINTGLVFRDDGLVVKQTFITQATQTHTGAHHDRGSPEVRAQNRGLTQGHTENGRPGPRCREQGAGAAVGGQAHSTQEVKASVVGGAPRKPGLMGEDHLKAGRPRGEPRVRPQQSYRMKRTTWKEEPPQS